MAGPERIELPPHGSKPRILSIELKAESGALNQIRTDDLSLTKGVLYHWSYKSRKPTEVGCVWSG
jgi:hypothetical protein